MSISASPLEPRARQPPFQRPGTDDNDEEYYCARCARYYPLQSFYASSVRTRLRRCKQCVVDEHRELRQNARKLSPQARLAKRLALHDRTAGVLPTEQAVHVLLDSVFDNRSALSGRPLNGKQAALVPLDSALPLGLNNCMLVDTEEARSLRTCVQQQQPSAIGDLTDERREQLQARLNQIDWSACAEQQNSVK